MTRVAEQLREMASKARDAAHLHEHHTGEESEVARWQELAARWEARALVLETQDEAKRPEVSCGPFVRALDCDALPSPAPRSLAQPMLEEMPRA